MKIGRLIFKTKLENFKPDLFAISSTEDMWELGMKVLDEAREYKQQNQTLTIAGSVSNFCS